MATQQQEGYTVRQSFLDYTWQTPTGEGVKKMWTSLAIAGGLLVVVVILLIVRQVTQKK